MTGAGEGGAAGARTRSAPVANRLRDAVPVDGRDGPWLALSLLPGLVAVAAYLATNPYPAYGGGLYVQIATEIAAGGYAPPASVPGYAVPVPFAYPPLGFYALAVLLDAGIDPLTVTRWLPGVAVVAGLVPAYLLGRDYTGSRAAGTATATAIALNPQVLEWHVSAGGVVRGFAFLYALAAIYAGYRVFAGDAPRRAMLGGTVVVALTGLSHPTYALFVVVSYLVLWAGFDRSLAGFGRGAAVGLGALVLASPWLGWVVATHGTGVFTAAAGTHGGVGGGAAALLAGDASPFEVVPLAAAAVALALRRDAPGAVTVAAWTAVATFAFAQPRFGYAVGTLAAATAGIALVERFDWPEAAGASTPRGRVLVATALVVVASVLGGGYLATEMSLVTDSSSPAFVDEEAVGTATWAATETPADATFVVVGDAAEWFPALSGRAIVVGPWGVEWASAAAYERQLDAFERLSVCRSHTCVETTAASVGASPDYVVVPQGRYTVRGETAVQFGSLERSFDLAGDWERVHETGGTVVYRATDRDGGE